ncbi:hypothetical protein VTI74DRAFT_7095 [Chaetomium olivicolor]
MGPSRGVAIPSAFYWLLPVQVPVAAVSVYAAVYAFGPTTVSFMLAVVGTTFHVLLCIYCLVNWTRPRHCHGYIIICWLVVCVGLWCGSLSYFAWHVNLINNSESGWATGKHSSRLLARFTKAGCALSALSVFINLVLLGASVLSLPKQRNQHQKSPGPGSSASSAVSVAQLPPQLPPLHLHRHRYSTSHQPSSAPAIPDPSPHPLTRPPSIHYPLFPAQSHHQNSLPAGLANQTPTARPPLNRVSLLLHLTHLQAPQGSFPPTPHLASLLQLWTGGREINIPASGRGATALAHACMIDCCQYIWRVQREGREWEMLGWEQMRELEKVGWDLRWAWDGVERAGVWLEGRRGK